MNRIRAILIRECALIPCYEESSCQDDYRRYLLEKLFITDLLDH
jgi:hypothetical protein